MSEGLAPPLIEMSLDTNLSIGRLAARMQSCDVPRPMGDL